MADDSLAAIDELLPAVDPARAPRARADRPGSASEGATRAGEAIDGGRLAGDAADPGRDRDAGGPGTGRDDHGGDDPGGGGGGGGAGGGGGGGDDEAGDGRGWLRRSWDAVGPRGPVQVAVAVVALAFLVGAVGFLLGSRQPVPTSAVDVGFLMDMSTHHDQAVTMAQCATGRAQDPVVNKFAEEVLIFQNRELGQMNAWMEQRNATRPDDDETRPAMGWMGMTTTAAGMPGMATPEQLDRLCGPDGGNVDRDFLTLMRAHHQGGVHMAEYAAENAASERIRAFARTVARNQRTEANEYSALLKRLDQS